MEGRSKRRMNEILTVISSRAKNHHPVWGEGLREEFRRFLITSEMKRLMPLCPLWRAPISSPSAGPESEYAYLLNYPFKGKGRGAPASLVFVQSHSRVQSRPNQSTRGRCVSMTVWIAWLVHVWRCGSSRGRRWRELLTNVEERAFDGRRVGDGWMVQC